MTFYLFICLFKFILIGDCFPLGIFSWQMQMFLPFNLNKQTKKAWNNYQLLQIKDIFGTIKTLALEISVLHPNAFQVKAFIYYHAG